MSNLWLILYFLAWVLTLVWYQSRKKCFDVGSFILGLYSLYAVFSIVYYLSAGAALQDLKLLPFIFLFLMLLAATLPVMQYNTRKVTVIQTPSLYLVVGIACVMAFVTLAELPSIIANFMDGIIRILIDSSAGAELYNETAASADDMGNGISNLFSIFSNAFSNFTVFFTFYLLTLRNRRLLPVEILLALSCAVLLISPVARGSRGETVIMLLTIMSCYILFRRFYSRRVKRVARIFIGIVGGLMVVFLSAITLSRFTSGASSETVDSSMIRYLGEENINFNIYSFDNGGIRYGDNVLCLFKLPFFKDTPRNYMELREKYPELKISNEVFSTFVGDFVFDFGPVIAFLIFILANVFLLKFTKSVSHVMPFHRLVLLYFPICVCAQGGMYLYSFAGIGGGLRFLVNLGLWAIFYLDLYIITRKHKNQRYE